MCHHKSVRLAVVLLCLGALWAPSVSANQVTIATTNLNTDFTVAGVGGMRDVGTATLTVTNIQGPVTAAYLFWQGPSKSFVPNANAEVYVDSHPITGANIGISGPSCWPNYVVSHAYRAEVTSLVAAKGNGTYQLTGFLKPGNINVNGASLIVFYQDNDPHNNRDVILAQGNDANFHNSYDSDNWAVLLSGLGYTNRHDANSKAFVQFHVADGQVFTLFDDDALRINGRLMAPAGAVFSGDSVPSANNGPRNNGSLWDIKTWEITTLLTGGTNDLSISQGYVDAGDCLNLVVVLVDLPAGSMGVPSDCQFVGQPPDLTVSADPDRADALVKFPLPAVRGSCSSEEVLCVPPSGSAFPVGTTAVTCAVPLPDAPVPTVSFKVIVVGVPPEWALKPRSISVPLGEPAYFASRATGNSTLHYQWKLKGNPLPEATNATLLIKHVTDTDVGAYEVAVTNLFGKADSKPVTLGLLYSPTITSQPQDIAAAPASTASFCVEATGTPPRRYQWRKNGVNLPGATAPCLSFPNVQIADGGTYSVVVANVLGLVASAPARLTITGLPTTPAAQDNFATRSELPGASGVVSTSNTGATKEAGEPNHAGKPGGRSVWYTWRAPSHGIATFRTTGSDFDTLLAVYTGTTLATLAPQARDEDRGGYSTSQVSFNTQPGIDYQVAIDGAAAAQGDLILSWSFEPTPEELPIIVSQPESHTVNSGGPVLLSVGATGQGLTYRWTFNGVELPNATEANLLLKYVKRSHVGSYTVRVANSQGRTVESQPAVVEIGASNLQSQDKLEELTPTGGTAPVASVLRASSTSAGAVSVYVHTHGSHTFHNAVSTNSGPSEWTAECGLPGGERRWFALRAEDAGVLTIDTQGSDIQTFLGVFALGAAEWVPVACYPEVPSGVQPSRVRFEALPGTEYFIGVDGQDGQTGVIQLNWSLGVPLSIRRQGLYLVFSWPGSFPDFILEESWAVGGPESVVWSPVDVQPVLVDGVYTASRLIPSGYRAYRLRKP